MPGSYRIILGDTCTICRAVSRITFPEERPPQLPIAGCRDPDGCRCTLPVFALTPGVEIPAGAHADAGGAPSNVDEARQDNVLPNIAPPPPPSPVTVSPPAAAPPVETPAPVRPAPPPDWSRPAPITEQRRRVLQDLTALYRQNRIQGIRLTTAPDCCDVCAEVAASIYAPSVVPPLPVVGCAHGWQCRCQYAEEPLPLDARGLGAISRLEMLERERKLRREGIAIGGPRPLHRAVVVVAAVAAGLSLWLAAADGGAEWRWRLALPLLLAVICALVAISAIQRHRPLPSPPWTYLLCGLGIAIVALGPLWGLRLPPELSLQHLDRLSGLTLTPSFTNDSIRGLPRPQLALAVIGVALLLLGLLDWTLATSDRRQ